MEFFRTIIIYKSLTPLFYFQLFTIVTDLVIALKLISFILISIDFHQSLNGLYGCFSINEITHHPIFDYEIILRLKDSVSKENYLMLSFNNHSMSDIKFLNGLRLNFLFIS